MSEQIEHQLAETVTETNVERGYGACSAAGCNCQAYGGSGDTCSNCGHNYSTHW